jgi:hypothetical protein
MKLTTILLPLLALAPLTSAVVVQVFSDESCTHLLTERNVWDNTCATFGDLGFRSYRRTYPGGTWQTLKVYTHNACAGPVSSAMDASREMAPDGKEPCYRAAHEEGASHAVHSGFNLLPSLMTLSGDEGSGQGMPEKETTNGSEKMGDEHQASGTVQGDEKYTDRTGVDQTQTLKAPTPSMTVVRFTD